MDLEILTYVEKTLNMMPIYGYLMKVCNKDRELCIVSNWGESTRNHVMKSRKEK